MTATPAPHDLVHIRDRRFLHAPAGLDPEAHAAAASSVPESDPGCWVVVRRAVTAEGMIPVGIRGRRRSERFAAAVPLGQITRVVTPDRVPRIPPAGRATLPAFRALKHISRDEYLRFRSGWGPGGSVGFELVTSQSTVTEASDLDVVIAASDPLDLEAAAAFLDRSAACGCRIDVQVVASAGAFALSEWVRERGELVAVRTATGPVLSSDPWEASA